ncbi:hypothetical protein COB55_03100 [Candidatus Wolfebacteria bacterium]|nr:MAG: hypothetical protein COB55_03100 [Candidatus Wolfebacteria bacterium]
MKEKRDLTGYTCGNRYCSAPVEEDKNGSGVICSSGHFNWFCTKDIEERERKIIQIQSAQMTDCTVVMHALCDDGTLWEKWHNTGWAEYPPIPQPDSKKQ